jgi:DivIVA domain-containing protein
MPLTPADVHNVAFKKPPIGKRGYDEDEVDGFLDEIERELARLIEENNDLKAQVERLGRGGAAPQAGPPVADPQVEADNARLNRENKDLKAQMERLQGQLQQARQNTGSMAPVAAGPGPAAGGDGEQQALRMLMMAQRTADETISDARREAEKLLTDARTKAEALDRESRAKAEALDRDARQRHQETMGGLETKRAALQKHIEELKAFEREYRTRLKAYLEGQLRDLDGRAGSIDSELARAGAGGNSSGGIGAAAGQGSPFGSASRGYPGGSGDPGHGR